MFHLHYSKPDTIDLSVLEEQHHEVVALTHSSASASSSSLSPFSIDQLQLYNPLYHKFFEMNSGNFDKIALNHTYHIQDMKHVKHIETGEIVEKPVFIKFSPLLDTFRYMTGKYKIDDPRIYALPRLESTYETVHSKILSTNNASYVDCFFNFLSSILLHKYNVVHGIDFYGSFLGLQQNFKTCVTDDVDYLRGSDFFQKHLGDLFFIEQSTHGEEMRDDLSILGGSRRNKRKLQLKSAHNVSLGFETVNEEDVVAVALDGPVVENPIIQNKVANEQVEASLEIVYTNQGTSATSTSTGSDSDADECSSDEEDDDADDDADDDETDENQPLIDLDELDPNEAKDQDEGWQTESDGSEDERDEAEIYAYIKQFPIQMICLEKCDSTMDQLLVDNKMNEEQGASALFQVIMTLLIYQKMFHFTHNDLHTNNIMYVNTDVEFLYYQFQGKVYKVPTYGRIFKIIDFGRSIYKFQQHRLCSDSFAPGGDAATQYNFEPFMNENKPRLEPNYSFDLARLGSSMYDFLIDEDDNPKHLDDFQKTVYRWCLDDLGRNILYKKNGEERYPNFKLYKMIARTVHQHTPEAQLQYPFFKQFMTNDVLTNETVLNIDVLPCYV